MNKAKTIVTFSVALAIMVLGKLGAMSEAYDRDPIAVGAHTKTSSKIANYYVEKVKEHYQKLGRKVRVLEIGPGDGAITIPLMRECGDLIERLDWVEKDGPLGQELQRELERLGVKHDNIYGYFGENGCAEKWCQGEAKEAYDVCIATLPWTLFPHSLVDAILANIDYHLAPGGLFMWIFLCGSRSLGNFINKHQEFVKAISFAFPKEFFKRHTECYFDGEFQEKMKFFVEGSANYQQPQEELIFDLAHIHPSRANARWVCWTYKHDQIGLNWDYINGEEMSGSSSDGASSRSKDDSPRED